MAINFPNNPNLNEIFASGENSWRWDGSSWVSIGSQLLNNFWVSSEPYNSGINTSSNVGIGTTIPSSKLFVVGDGRFTGVITASSFSGNATSSTYATTAGVAGISTYTSEWILGANGSSDYTFTGPGFDTPTADPTLFLIRGQQYKFTNTMGMHPFRIQTTPNGSVGSQYNSGITNNDVSNGTLTWNVQFNAPSILYYQCTAHSTMGGKINIVDSNWITSSNGGTYTLNNVGIGTTVPTSLLHVVGNALVSGIATFSNLVDLDQITETTVNNFNSTLSPSSGTLTIDTSLGTVFLGDLNASVTTWAFTNVPTINGRSTTVTLIIDGDTAQTYGDACTVNGSSITGGVKWTGGSGPTSTNNFDIISFTIVRDGTGTINVFGTGTMNFS